MSVKRGCLKKGWWVLVVVCKKRMSEKGLVGVGGCLKRVCLKKGWWVLVAVCKKRMPERVLVAVCKT